MSKRQPLLVAPELSGRDYVRAHARATDDWFRAVAEERIDDLAHMALLAVGGYGRGELFPFSDVDVVLVHTEHADGGDLAEALWYPAWDRGLNLGYVVVTLDQAETLLGEEFEWATAFLDTRLIAGNPDLQRRIDELTAKAWATRRDELLDKLAHSVADRHDERGDAAAQIEPNVKEGRGGLRDVHAMGWASRAMPGFAEEFLYGLDVEVDLLLQARVELHRLAGRAGDVLTLDDQDAVAGAMGYDGSGPFMLELARAARRIAWCSDEAWGRWSREHRAAEGPGVLTPTSVHDRAHDRLLPLRLAAEAATRGMIIDRDDLCWLQDNWTGMPDPWPAEARELFAALWLAGRPAVKVIEDLDHFRLMERILPEWTTVQCRPQRNVLHTFTVDRHLCEAAVNASALVDRVTRPDLLVVGALFHDIGKGYPGDHTEVGQKIIAAMAERMGYPDDDVAVLVDLCRHHLLLPDIATRRDLSDPGTIRTVAAAVDTVEFLDLLAALTEADSLATGPSAWGTWKAGLLEQLVNRTNHVLEGGRVQDMAVREFPDNTIVEIMNRGVRYLDGRDNTLTVVAHDRIGLFSALAGALAVHGLEIVDAVSHSATSNDASMAAYEFTFVIPETGPVEWGQVYETVNRALDGRLALRARIQRRAKEQARYQRRLSASPPRHKVLVDNEISDWATVIEVQAPDQTGLLYLLTKEMQELQLDIRRAKIQTFGPQAVDSFYVTMPDGEKVNDRQIVDEITLALSDIAGNGPAHGGIVSTVGRESVVREVVGDIDG